MEKEWKDVRTGLPPDLIDLIFSWSLEDIFNENLYRDKVDEIPQVFKSASHYLGSFVFPLMEEVRTELFSSFEVISDAPFSEIESIKPKCSVERIYEVKVQSWQNGSDCGSNDSYRPVTGDVFVLTDVKPESVSDLSRYGRSYIMASIVKVSDYGESLTDFIVEAAKTVALGDGMVKSLFAVFLLNLTASSPIWKALGIGVPQIGNTNVIKEVLCYNPLVGQMCNRCNPDHVNSFSSSSLSGLNDSQIRAVLGSISEMKCDHRCSVKLIWGPPGTGKTRTVTELLWILLMMKHEALVCGPTNISVLEASSRLLKLVKKNREPRSVDGALCHSLGDIILYGNNRRLKLSPDNDLYDIYLDNRVDRLVECFAPFTGWRHRVSVLIDFLQNCISQYHMHLENEKYKESQEDGTNSKIQENQDAQEGSIPFLQFLRERFQSQALLLEECVSYLCSRFQEAHLTT